MFQAVFVPLENRLATFNDWWGFGIDFEGRRRSNALGSDLAVLGRLDRPIDLPAGPQCFSEALGALYVLEGSTLGGKLILADISRRLGDAIAGATHFLAGHGANAGSMWLAFRQALDGYAAANPDLAERIVDGAIQSFHLFEDAMVARREGAFSLPGCAAPVARTSISR